MDVEKIQRINNLAVELQKQGLATSKEDAVAQAERIFNVQNKTVLSQKPMQGSSLAPGAPSLTNQNPQSTTSPSLNHGRVEEILEKNTKFMVSTIKQFQEEIKGLKEEIAKLKYQMVNMPRAGAPQRGSMSNQGLPNTSNPVAAMQAANNQSAQTPKPQAPAAPSKPVPASHPRSGRFNDDDVSIEKFFYAGK